MSPGVTTILLNRSAQHSIDYNHNDNTMTVNLPDPYPLDKVPNKRRLMLLIYFAQRDQDRTTNPTHRRIDAEVSLDVRIVERLIWGFSNIAQAKRTLKEYTEVGNEVATAAGMLRTRTEPDAFGKGTRAITMTITREIKYCILEWMNDILAPENIHKRPAEMSVSRVRKNEIIDLSSPVPDAGSDDDLQIIGPPRKRMRTKRPLPTDEGVLTPGSTRSFPPGVHEPMTSPPAATENFQKLFPSSPAAESTTGAPIPGRSIIEIEDTPVPDTTENPSIEESSEFMDARDTEMDGGAEDEVESEENEDKNDVEEQHKEKHKEPIVLNIPPSFATKLHQYSKHLYVAARKGRRSSKSIRKYSRKLIRLARRFKEAQDAAS